ncbi:MAG: alpha-2-macroglobulin [Geobacteraceae bacterium]|nr:alpha-2-macroglobulin [Geobacteraceae bacterium]
MKKMLALLLVSILLPVLAYADTLTVTTNKTTYAKGEVMAITAVYKNSSGTPITNPNTREVRIKNPSGTELVQTSMTNAGNGVYTYNYKLSTSAPTGTWEVRGKFAYNGTETKTYTYPKVATSTTDTTAPVTTASPAAGTYTAAQSVTLTRNEAGTTYYTTNGTTPTTSSTVYSTPIAITATTTLKYFSRDTAGNSEAVKTGLYTINIVTGKTHDAANTSLTWTGYGTCLTCHRTSAADMYQGVHYQWMASGAKMTTGPAAKQGKMDSLDGSSALNAYCINIMDGWKACGACHAGTGNKPVATTTPSDAQLAEIDCLMCHKNGTIATPYARTRNATTGLFEPNVGVDMNNVVRTVIKPVRNTCLGCHAKAGGGDAVKRGDIALASGTTADSLYDVHMATSRGNMTCQNCHKFTNHKVAGRGSDLRPQDSTVAVTCATTTCHPTKTGVSTGHATSGIQKHTARVACQTCHLPIYAKDANDTTATEATETNRTWEHNEWNATLLRYEPLPTKGSNLVPKYAFWNGTSWGNNLNDAAVIDPTTGFYKISRPNGAITDPAGTKLYPFKYKTAQQPLDTTTGKLIGLSTRSFFADGNYVTAVNTGLANMGRTGDAWQTVTTDEYQVLNHQIPPASGNALSCSACHPNTTATKMKLITNFGYGLKKPTSDLCNDCHGIETMPSYTSFHSRHVDNEGYDCSLCHNFSRPERGLKMTK